MSKKHKNKNKFYKVQNPNKESNVNEEAVNISEQMDGEVLVASANEESISENFNAEVIESNVETVEEDSGDLLENLDSENLSEESNVENSDVEESEISENVENDTVTDEPTVIEETESVDEPSEDPISETVESAEETVESEQFETNDDTTEQAEVSERPVQDNEPNDETNPENGEVSEVENVETDKEAEEKALRKAEKKAKQKAWVKAHKGFIVSASLVLFVIIAVIVGHFVSTMHMVFIHSGNDLIKASNESKKSELKFKSDVTVDEDITLTGYTLDLDKYTLTVNGNLTIKNADAYIGKQLFLWSKFTNGGKIEVNGRLFIDSKETLLLSIVKADSVVILGENALVNNTVEPIEAEYTNVWFNRTEDTETVVGTYSADVGTLEINSQTKANINSNSLATITLNGEVNEINGGDKVHLKNNSKSTFVSNCTKLYINERAIWGGFDGNTVLNHYFVQKLANPELMISSASGEFEVHISHVDNADAYMVVYDGLEAVRVEKEFDKNYTTYQLPTRDPGSYELKVYAISNNPDEFNDGDTVTTKVEIYSTLDKPQIISCEKIENEEGEKYILTIKSVNNALSYNINVGGKKLTALATAEEYVTVNLTSLIDGVGTYNITVSALANGTNYKESEPELYSFINTVTLKLGEITESENEGQYTYSWDAVTGAVAYEVVYGNTKVITTSNSITLDTQSAVSVKPLGKGYYKDGESVKFNPSTVEPEQPENPGEE